MPVPATRSVHRRSLLRDDVYRSIRDAIVRGEIEPGERLVDADLQAWLGVSRTPIREALLRLERTGLVTAIPGRATMATPYDPAVVEESRVVAAELHALATRLAVPRLGEDDLTALSRANEDLRAGIGAGDAGRAVAADDDFHAVFVDRSGNAVLAAQLEQAMPLLRRAEYLHFDSAEASASAELHERIIAAAGNGEADLCADLVRRNWMVLA
ncbi:GntR family transcriptional regulator [Sediminivirga luteola]|uniref:GntR family transcriptional regulator n=1 Tax=Sediminivirga luteola TaxID=1774748 RepID=UPI001F5A3683|nr:GntR family transcriptional regulator [Sediminivirga luteola]MCI2264231.1 GntR family transcriptional regulator [Sediminivirga luteola]